MIKIGFVDYYLDNWHCNYYPGFLREAIRDLGYEITVTHAYGMITSPDGVTSEEWCRAHDVICCGTIEELVESVDAICVIAADDARFHDYVCDIPLMSGKPVFVDKTFAYDTARATRFFALAEEYGTPVFSASAQRYCQDVIDYKKAHPERPLFVSTVGPHSLDRYAVHQLDVIEALMGPGVKRLKAFAAGEDVTQLILDYGPIRDSGAADDSKPDPDAAEPHRWASFMQTPQPYAEFNFMVTQTGSGMEGARLESDDQNFYANLSRVILDFFRTKEVPVPHEETLEVVRLIELARLARKQPDTWFEV